MIAPVTHVTPLAYVRRSRMLPIKGRIVVRVGQKVNATDIVAEVDLPGSHLLIDVRRILGLRRTEQAHRLIERKVNERVEKGDILAQTGGLLPRVIRAPQDGKIVAIQRGQLLLEKSGDKLEVKAGLNGTISEILPERGVVVEVNGALVQGVWGNGQVNLGLLNCLAKSPDEELTRANLDVTLRGSVVLSGFVRKADTLQAADELPLRGLILGSMSSDLIAAAQSVSYPIVLLEGFGHTPINQAAFRLLSTHDKRDISINAAWDLSRGERPEIIVPLPAAGQALRDLVEFTPGQTVRMTAPPFSGITGTLLSLRPGQTNLPNGQRAAAADIRLGESQVITIPLANLDVLE